MDGLGNRRAFWRASRSTGEAVTLERRGAAKARTAVYFMLILMLWMVKESSAMVMAKMIIQTSILTLRLYTSTPQALLGEDSDDPVAIHLSR